MSARPENLRCLLNADMKCGSYPGPFCDLVWSDPEEGSDNWVTSPRGAGYLFGEAVTEKFMDTNQLTLLCRAHQLVNEGKNSFKLTF